MAVNETRTSSPTAPEREEIVRVVNLYVNAFKAGDAAMFRGAFHPSARIMFTDAEGALTDYLVADCIDNWAEMGWQVSGRILSVTQAGEVATVLLGFDDDESPADSWVDIHSLLKIDGTWKIMNKTATHASRAAWAAPSAQTTA
jgi:hypothetical protein